MKSFIAIALLLVLAIAQTPEDCVKEKCKNEYNSCVKEVFGCAAVGYKCQSKCGADDDACYQKCAYDSGNQKFIALYECGKLNCPKTGECDLIGCTDKFNSQCLTQNMMQSIQCALNFFETYPQCECVKDQ